MQEGQTITTSTGEKHKIVHMGLIFAKTYQLDQDGKPFKLHGKDGFLEGRITINETKLLDL